MRIDRTMLASILTSIGLACSSASDFGAPGQGSAKQEKAKPADETSGKTSSGVKNKTKQNSGDADDEGEIDEGAIADKPVQVSGAFLVDCSWLANDDTAQSGLGGCAIKDATNSLLLGAAQISVDVLTLHAVDGPHSLTPLPGDDTKTFHFPIAYEFYGQELKLDVQFTYVNASDQGPGVNAEENSSHQASSLKISNLPAAITHESGTQSSSSSSIATNTATASASSTSTSAATAANAASYESFGFKLGDDGLGNAEQCPEIEGSIANNNFGKEFHLEFDVAIDPGDSDDDGTTPIKIAFERICGHGSGNSGSTAAARWELKGTSIEQGGSLPFSSAANAAADSQSSSPTTSFSPAEIQVGNGRYHLRVFAAAATGTALDDFVLANLKLDVAGFKLVKVEFK